MIIKFLATVKHFHETLAFSLRPSFQRLKYHLQERLQNSNISQERGKESKDHMIKHMHTRKKDNERTELVHLWKKA